MKVPLTADGVLYLHGGARTNAIKDQLDLLIRFTSLLIGDRNEAAYRNKNVNCDFWSPLLNSCCTFF